MAQSSAFPGGTSAATLSAAAPTPHAWRGLLAAWLAATALACFVDQPLADFFRSTAAGKHLRPLFGFVEYMGQYPIHLLVLALLIGYGLRRRAIAEYAALMIGTSVIVTALKYTVGRARPGNGQGAFFFQPLGRPGSGLNSFPSGDAAAAMALATLLGCVFPRARWLFWGLGLWAALGRVAQGRHHLSDALFGAGLGVASVWVGLWASRRFFPPRRVPHDF